MAGFWPCTQGFLTERGHTYWGKLCMRTHRWFLGMLRYQRSVAMGLIYDAYVIVRRSWSWRQKLSRSICECCNNWCEAVHLMRLLNSWSRVSPSVDWLLNYLCATRRASPWRAPCGLPRYPNLQIHQNRPHVNVSSGSGALIQPGLAEDDLTIQPFIQW